MKGNSTPGRVLTLVAIIFGSVVLHELGHALVAQREGLPAPRSPAPIGGGLGSWTMRHAVAPQVRPRGNATCRIALAGPLVNIAIALVSAAVVLTRFPEANLWMKPLVHSNHLLRSLVWFQFVFRAL